MSRLRRLTARKITPGTDAMIWQTVSSSYIGGVERHIEILADSFKRVDVPCEILLFGNFTQNPWIDQLKRAGLSYRIIDDSLGAMIAALRAHKPGLLHAHGYKACILGRLAAKATGTPVVASNHESERGVFPLNLYRRVDDWSGFLSTNIAVSEAIQRRFPFKSHHLPNYSKIPASVVDAPLPRHVALVGRLVEVKRADLFCEIARRAPPGLSWHVYGDGPLRAGLEAKYGDVVTFHGTIKDMSAVWPRVGLLMMTSASEGHPYAALEALSHGVPVLASRVGGIVGTVVPGVSGWLFENGDADGALSGLKAWMAIDAAGQIDLRRACWTFVRETFSEDVLLPRLFDIYREAGYAAALPTARIGTLGSLASAR